MVLSAVVTGSAQPTGKVTFYNGASSLGSATLDSTGTATLSTAKLPVGSNTLTAKYGGDSLDAKSTSAAAIQTVNPAQITITLTSSPNPSTSKQKVTFTASIVSNGGAPTGSLTFSNNGTSLGTARIVGGTATFSTTALPSGTDLVTATYAGDANHAAASGSVTQTVN